MPAHPHLLALFAVSALLVAPASAQVGAQEAARLGAELTPMGAERAGNADGTLPAWTGGITRPPEDYAEGGQHPDPFADDEVLFRITAANLEAHAARLAEGSQALLRAHPESWWMNVYPSRRSASFPEWVYEAVVANATRARLVLEGKGSVDGARVGPPFPIPKSGVEVIWNHNLRWRGVRVTRSQGLAAVTRRGNYRVTLAIQELGIPYASQSDTAFQREHPNIMLAIKSKNISPELLAGDGTLVIEPLDQTLDPRKAWIYTRALRRVVRLPYFGYEFSDPNTENLRTVDDAWLFNGPPDRFEWSLLGKRELYVPYNAYRLDSGDVGPGDILRESHIDPALARYELHRVWVVQGTLREGQKHVYSRRVFYVDEDSWNIVLAESYDRKGELWRVNEGHLVNYYEVPVPWATLYVYNDLQERRYLVVGLDNGRAPPRFSEGGNPKEFTPNALLYYVR